jgi:voltage-gated potassium channel
MIPIPFIWVLVRLIHTLWISLKDPEFQALSFLVVVTLASGAVFYRVAEGWSLFDSFSFSVITLTTIGFGSNHQNDDDEP